MLKDIYEEKKGKSNFVADPDDQTDLNDESRHVDKQSDQSQMFITVVDVAKSVLFIKVHKVVDHWPQN